MSIDWNKVYNKAADKMKTRVPTAAPSAAVQTTVDYDKEMSRLQEVRRQAAVDMDMDTVNAADNAMKELRARAGKQTFLDRAGDVVGAAAAGTVGNIANAVNTVQALAGKKDVDYRLADNAAKDSQRFTQSAKEGLGSAGQFAVDAGVSGLQLMGDFAASAMVPGSGIAVMGARSFGGAAQEARQSGASVGQQAAYGLGSAAASVLTEKLSNVSRLFGKTFGAGVLDKALSKLTAKPMGKLVASALSEGSEEFLEAAVQPLLKKLTYDPNAAYDADWLADALYSSAVGGVLGGLGGGVDVVTAGKAQDAATPGAGLRATERTGVSSPEEKTPVKAVSAPPAVETNEGLAAAQIMAQEMAATETQDNLVESLVRSLQPVTNKQAAAVLDDADAVAQLGIDTNGMTRSQQRAAVKQKVEQMQRKLPAGQVYRQEVRQTQPAGRSQADVAAELEQARVELRDALDYEAYADRAGEWSTVSSAIERTRKAQARVDALEAELSAAPKAGAADNTVDIMESEAQRLFGQEKTVPEVGTVTVRSGQSAINERNRSKNTLAYTLATSIDKVSDMEPVSRLTGMELNDRAKKPSEQIAAFFKSIGNKVVRAGFGDVSLGEYGVGGMLNHRPLNRAKMLSLAAVPDVIQNGRQIGYTDDWKGRGYKSYIFAAPVKVGGADVYVAAVVDQRPDNKFYLSEMVDSEGNYVRIDEESPSGNSKNGVTEGAELASRAGITAGPEGLSGKGTPSKLDTAVNAAPNFTPETLEPVPSVNPNIAHPSDSVNTADGDMNAVGAAAVGSVNTDYDTLQARSSSFHPEGANVAEGRHVDVPVHGFDGRNISRVASNIQGAQMIPEDVVPMIQQMVADGKFSYRTLSDRKSLLRAEHTVRSAGFEGAVERLRNQAKKGTDGKDTVTLALTLLNNAANAGDGNTTAEICALLQSVSTNAGQTMQALSILRKLSPASQLYGIQKVVSNLNEGTARRSKRRGSDQDNVPVDQWMTKTGEILAHELGAAVGQTTAKEKTVSQRVLADLRKLAGETVAAKKRNPGNRTQMDAVYDMFHNREQYEKALAAAKETVAKEYGSNPAVMAALEGWMQAALDYTTAFTEAATGQTEIRVPTELADKFLAQTDQAGRDAVMKEIYQSVADQMPATWQEQWNAWRHLAMLANPRTHVRNIVGNLGFQPVRVVKNQIAAALETAFQAAGVEVERTKSFAASPALYRAAWNDYDNIAKQVSGSRYDDAAGEIQKLRTIFGWDALEKLRKMNSEAMELEDAVFKRITYADSLAGYLKANGVTADQMESGTVPGDVLADARTYAANEALKATYQDENALSNRVVQMARAAGPLGEAVMPFKRTPANILKRALEYSPVGLVKSLTVDLAKVRNKEMTAAQAIDNTAAGITGTGLFALGATLFAQGLLTGAQGDDEDDKWKELLGHQGYALELGDGTSVTLDWLAPEALPFFMGAELMSAMGESGFTMEAIWSALKSVANPMLEMSMLQSVRDLVDSVKYAEGNPLAAMVPSLLISYFQQAIPTFLGQMERTGEDVRMTTYTEKSGALPADFQYALGRASARIPGLEYHQIPYIDAWGREEETGDVMERAVNNLFNPAYVSKVEMDKVEAELQRLRDATGNTAVFPDRAAKSFPVDGETKYLTAEEYVKYAKAKGQTGYSYVSAAVSMDFYRKMSDDGKAEYLDKLYGYANYKAKKTVVPEYESDTYRKCAEAEAVGVSPVDYYAMHGEYDYDGNGSVTQAEAQQYLDGQTDLTREQKADLWTIINKSWKKNPYA